MIPPLLVAALSRGGVAGPTAAVKGPGPLVRSVRGEAAVALASPAPFTGAIRGARRRAVPPSTGPDRMT
ncbi:hypothetical protein GCM10017778_32800 [Streptomyces vinaceus]|nr:hypothetical protein GCM10017778_32800 [Streptomyces vinaceus]